MIGDGGNGEGMTPSQIEKLSNSAQLNDLGVLESDQVPDYIVAGLDWMGTIDVTTGTLDAPSSGNSGNFYKVSVGGTSSITGESVSFTVGDWIISDGTDWDIVPNTSTAATTEIAGNVQLAGDIGGTYNNVLVDKIQGKSIDFSDIAEGYGITVSEDQLSLELTDINVHKHLNKSILDSITEAFTVDLKEYYDNSAQLDSTGKLLNSQIPESLVAGLEWKGTFNASTDTLPTASTSNNGNFYKVSVAGTIVLSGITTDLSVGDWLISNGTSWEQIPTSIDSATTTTEGLIKLAGDIAGTSESIIVTGIQGVEVSTTTPTDGQVLEYDSSAGKYAPVTQISASTDKLESDDTDYVAQVSASGFSVIDGSTTRMTGDDYGIKFEDDIRVAGTTIGTGGSSVAKNVVHGFNSLSQNTTGRECVALGYQSLYSNTTGLYNIGIGTECLYTEKAANYNIAIGYRCLKANLGGYHVAIGVEALACNTLGSGSIALGLQALKYNTTGGYSVALGYTALKCNTTGDENVALGYDALRDNISGNKNIALGHNAMTLKTGGSENIGIGNQALANSTTVNYNVAVGYLAGLGSTHDFNTFIGTQAGYNSVTGKFNTCIGYNANASNSTVSGEFTLGSDDVSNLRCNVTSISSLSDIRDKTDVIDSPFGLDFLNEVRVIDFLWETREGNVKDGTREVGYSAQDLIALMDKYDNGRDLRLANDTVEERLEADYNKMGVVTVKAVQELSAIVEAQSKLITELTARLDAIGLNNK